MKSHKGNPRGGDMAAAIAATQAGRDRVRAERARSAQAPRFTPRALQELAAKRQAACNAEGLPETKLALANLVSGMYFIMGEYFNVYEPKKPSTDGSGELKTLPPVIEKNEEGKEGTWIPGYWLHFGQLGENLFKGPPALAAKQRKIWETVTEYIGDEILDPLRKASADRNKQVKWERMKAAERAEMEEYVKGLIASANTDLIGLFHRKIPGGYKLPTFGTVVELRPTQQNPVGDIYVLKSEDPVLRAGMEKGWFLPFRAIDWQEVRENEKFAEEQRKLLHAFQSGLWTALREARAATHMPITKAAEEPLVVKREKVVKPAEPMPTIPVGEALKLEESILKIDQTSNGLYYIRAGSGRVYMQAWKGSLVLLRGTESVGGNNILAELLAIHGNGNLIIACQSIRQAVRESSEEEDIKEMVSAKRAFRRILNDMYVKEKTKYDEANPAPKKPEAEPASRLAVALSDGDSAAPKSAMASALANAGLVQAPPCTQ